MLSKIFGYPTITTGMVMVRGVGGFNDRRGAFKRWMHAAGWSG